MHCWLSCTHFRHFEDFEKSTRQWRVFNVLETRIYERPLTSEPFIENQSEHISKLSLHQSLVKRKFITKCYRRAREPSRISLRFLRRLKNKSSVLKKFLFKRISSILIPKSSKLHRYVKKVRKLYNTRYKCNHKHDPKIFYLIKVTVPKKTSLLSLSSWFYHVIMKLKCKARRYLSLIMLRLTFLPLILIETVYYVCLL